MSSHFSVAKSVALLGLAGLIANCAQAVPVIGVDTGPDVIINWDGTTATVLYGQNNGPYEGPGGDDTYLIVRNTSVSTILYSISLTGNGIFGFDGDGGATLIGDPTPDPTGYADSRVSFSVVDVNFGTVNFLHGINPGSLEWFTLETDISGTSGHTITVNAAPVPDSGSTVALAGGALLGLAALRRRLARAAVSTS